MKKIELTIEGMKCEGCVGRINKVLSNISQLESYHVLLGEGKLVLQVKTDQVLQEVIQKITALGFGLK